MSGLKAPRHFPRQLLPWQTRIFSDFNDDDGDGDGDGDGEDGEDGATMAETKKGGGAEIISRHTQSRIVFDAVVAVVIFVDKGFRIEAIFIVPRRTYRSNLTE